MKYFGVWMHGSSQPSTYKSILHTRDRIRFYNAMQSNYHKRRVFSWYVFHFPLFHHKNLGLDLHILGLFHSQYFLRLLLLLSLTPFAFEWKSQILSSRTNKRTHYPFLEQSSVPLCRENFMRNRDRLLTSQNNIGYLNSVFTADFSYPSKV
jgi:hypothetical protein